MMVEQMNHLKLQINAITNLQAGQLQLQQQMQIVQNQQDHLKKLINEYEYKLDKLSMASTSPSQPRSSRGDPPPYPQHMQFNINMHHQHNDHKKYNQNNLSIENKENENKTQENDKQSDRWKVNPILQFLQQMQGEIISKQNANLSQKQIQKIANKYNLPELMEKINTSTNYLLFAHKKLLLIRGSVRNSKYHSVSAVDLYNKTKYELLKEDPITKWTTWDITFGAFIVIPNIPSSLLVKSITNQREQMIFSIRNGIKIKNQRQPYLSENKQSSQVQQRNIYLHNKFVEAKETEEKKCADDNKYNNSPSTCSILLRCGGCLFHEDNSTTNRVDGLNINNGDWLESLPNLRIKRYGPSIAYSKNNGVLVIGGIDGNKTLNIVEQWNITKGDDGWDMLPQMNQSRYSPSCAIYGEGIDECLFVGGGYLRETKKILKSAEVYNFNVKCWTKIKSMRHKRYASGCCVWNKASMSGFGGEVVIGGGVNPDASRSVEIYNSYKDEWYSLPDTVHQHRNNPAIWICKEYGTLNSSFNGLLCIAGDTFFKKSTDFNGNFGEIKGKIEVYDPRASERDWRTVEDLNNILIDNKNSIIRGMIPFS